MKKIIILTSVLMVVVVVIFNLKKGNDEIEEICI